MRKRDIKIGMEAEHARSGKYLGRVTRITDTLVYLDGPSPIATPAEMSPRTSCSDVHCPEEVEVTWNRLPTLS